MPCKDWLRSPDLRRSTPRAGCPLAQRLPYTVSFANSPDASQYVQEVRVVTQLDEDLDIFSFRLGDINIGKIDVHIPSDRALFQGEFDFTNTRRLYPAGQRAVSINSHAKRPGCCRRSTL